MNRTFQRASFLVLVAALAVAADLPARAATRPLQQKQISRGAQASVRPSAEPRASHLIFGTLRSVKGAALVLATRHGTLQRVDAGAAIAAGTYSAPLFVGKIVAVGGFFDAAHVLHAQSVTRMTRLDPSTRSDF